MRLALENNDSSAAGLANDNNAFGNNALINNVDGDSNNAFGSRALSTNVTGHGNCAFGHQALEHNDNTGNGFANFNTAIGDRALVLNTDGSSNTAVGSTAMFSNTTGLGNNAFSSGALFSNQTGSINNAFGGGALHENAGGTATAPLGISRYLITLAPKIPPSVMRQEISLPPGVAMSVSVLMFTGLVARATQPVSGTFTLPWRLPAQFTSTPMTKLARFPLLVATRKRLGR